MDILKKLNPNFEGENLLPDESWQYFLGLLTKSIIENKNEWLSYFFKIKKYYLINKFFTKSRKVVKVDQIDTQLRMELKKFFSALQTTTKSKEFLNKVNHLPLNVQFLIARKCIAISNIDDLLKIDNSVLESNNKKVKSLRKKFADQINKLSLHYDFVLDTKTLLILYKSGALFENNMLNRGICEFIVKLIDNEESCKALSDTGLISKAEIQDIRKEFTSYPSFQEYTKLKNINSFFNDEGEQISRRFENAIELLDGIDFSGYVIDNNSIYKEPIRQIDSVNFSDFPEENMAGDSEMNGGSGGGSFGGGFGGGNFSNSADIEIPDIDQPSDSGEEFSQGDNDVETEIPEEFGSEVEQNNEDEPEEI